MSLQDMELSPDEQLLDNALRMDHELARGIVFESLTTDQDREDEDFAFAHIFHCMDLGCGEFWQEMLAEYPDKKSEEKLRKPEHHLNPLWERRN